MRPRSGTAGTCRGGRAARSSHDVGPGAAHDLLALLVARHGLEDVELAAVLFAEVLERRCGGDRVAGADGLAPGELLAAVDHAHEVDPDLAVEDRRTYGPGRVDDREHRRRDDIAEAGRSRCVAVEVDGVRLS